MKGGKMRLYIVRHAWAGERNVVKYPDDAARPLTDDGRKRFGRMVKRLAEAGWQPSLLATSPLVRCRQTADLIAAHVEGAPKIAELDALAPGSDLEQLVRWSQGKDDGLAWVGHAPDVGLLAARLIGGGSGAIDFAKGAVASIKFEDGLAIGEGQLEWLVTAKVLGC
jgi:phosphohistidine phosphatase